jgi:hypothetical protein
MGVFMNQDEDVALKLSQWMEVKVLEASKVEKKSKLTDLFRTNYDYWTQTFFPLIRGQGSAHRQLAEFLNSVGYEQVDESYVSTLMNRIKKERETRGSVKSSSPTPKVQGRPGAVAVVTPPVVQEEGVFHLAGMTLEGVRSAIAAADSWTDELDGYWKKLMSQADALGWNQVKRFDSNAWHDYGKEIGNGHLRFMVINLIQARKKFFPQE